MAKVFYVFRDPADFVAAMHANFAALASHTLAGTALTDAPPAVPMSGGAEPAGAAKPLARGVRVVVGPRAGGREGGATGDD